MPVVFYTKEFFFRNLYLFFGFFSLNFIFYIYSDDLLFLYVNYLVIFCTVDKIFLIASGVLELFHLKFFVSFVYSIYFYLPFFLVSVFIFFCDGVFRSTFLFFKILFLFFVILFYLIFPVVRFVFFVDLLFFFLSFREGIFGICSYLSVQDLINFFNGLDVCVFFFFIFLVLFAFFVKYFNWFISSLREFFYLGFIFSLLFFISFDIWRIFLSFFFFVFFVEVILFFLVSFLKLREDSLIG